MSGSNQRTCWARNEPVSHTLHCQEYWDSVMLVIIISATVEKYTAIHVFVQTRQCYFFGLHLRGRGTQSSLILGEACARSAPRETLQAWGL